MGLNVVKERKSFQNNAETNAYSGLSYSCLALMVYILYKTVKKIKKGKVYIIMIRHSYSMMIAKALEFHLHEATVGKETG